MVTTTQFPDKNKKGTRRAAGRWSFLRHDFSLIHRASIVFAFCAAIGGALVYGSLFLLEKQLDAVRITQLQGSTIQEKLRLAEIDKRQIHDFQTPYAQLVFKGFVGPEKRLDWIETVQAIQKNNALLPINYAIGEQQVFQVDSTIGMGLFELLGSKITVNMDIFHEMELTDFLEGLKTNQYYYLKSCNITRLPDYDINHLSPLLHVECTLYWITLGKRNPPNSGEPALPNS